MKEIEDEARRAVASKLKAEEAKKKKKEEAAKKAKAVIQKEKAKSFGDAKQDEGFQLDLDKEVASIGAKTKRTDFAKKGIQDFIAEVIKDASDEYNLEQSLSKREEEYKKRDEEIQQKIDGLARRIRINLGRVGKDKTTGLTERLKARREVAKLLNEEKRAREKEEAKVKYKEFYDEIGAISRRVVNQNVLKMMAEQKIKDDALRKLIQGKTPEKQKEIIERLAKEAEEKAIEKAIEKAKADAQAKDEEFERRRLELIELQDKLKADAEREKEIAEKSKRQRIALIELQSQLKAKSEIADKLKKQRLDDAEREKQVAKILQDKLKADEEILQDKIERDKRDAERFKKAAEKSNAIKRKKEADAEFEKLKPADYEKLEDEQNRKLRAIYEEFAPILSLPEELKPKVKEPVSKPEKEVKPQVKELPQKSEVVKAIEKIEEDATKLLKENEAIKNKKLEQLDNGLRIRRFLTEVALAKRRAKMGQEDKDSELLRVQSREREKELKRMRQEETDSKILRTQDKIKELDEYIADIEKAEKFLAPKPKSPRSDLTLPKYVASRLLKIEQGIYTAKRVEDKVKQRTLVKRLKQLSDNVKEETKAYFERTKEPRAELAEIVKKARITRELDREPPKPPPLINTPSSQKTIDAEAQAEAERKAIKDKQEAFKKQEAITEEEAQSSKQAVKKARETFVPKPKVRKPKDTPIDKEQVTRLIRQKFLDLTDNTNKYPRFSVEREYAKQHRINFDNLLGEVDESKGALSLKDVEEIFKKAEPLPFTEKEIENIKRAKLQEEQDKLRKEKVKQAEAEAKAKAEAISVALAKAKAEADAKAKAVAEAEAKAVAKAKAVAEDIAKREAEGKVLREAEAKAKRDKEKAEDKELFFRLKEGKQMQKEDIDSRRIRTQEKRDKEKAEAEAKLKKIRADAEEKAKQRILAERVAYETKKIQDAEEAKAKAEAEAEAEAKAKAKADFIAETKRPPKLQPELVKAPPDKVSRLEARLGRVKSEVRPEPSKVVPKRAVAPSVRPEPSKVVPKSSVAPSVRPKKESDKLKESISRMANIPKPIRDTPEGNSTLFLEFQRALDTGDIVRIEELSEKAEDLVKGNLSKEQITKYETDRDAEYRGMKGNPAEYQKYERSRPEVNKLIAERDKQAIQEEIKSLRKDAPKRSFFSLSPPKLSAEQELTKSMAKFDDRILSDIEDGKPLVKQFNEYRAVGDLQGMKKVEERATLLQAMSETGVDISAI
jgi:hypothetical protein